MTNGCSIASGICLDRAALGRYSRLSLQVPLGDGEAVSDLLWVLEPLGLEIVAEGEGCRIDAYFDGPVPDEADPLLSVPDLGVVGRRIEEVLEQDWLEGYRRAVQPVEVGSTWLIDPREPDGTSVRREGRETLVVPARRAFGTGSHESTRLALIWMEAMDLAGRHVLDLGTGSAILSIAATRLGAASVTAVDIDPVACFVAHDNQRLNSLDLRLVAGGLECLRRRRFDAALINILPSEWIESAEALALRLVPGAVVVFSGIPIQEQRACTERLRRAGIDCEGTLEEGEWVALRAIRTTR